MMNYYGWHAVRPFHPFGFGWVLGLIFWVFIGLLIVAIVKNIREGHNDKVSEEENPDRALQILKERYAKGEIGKVEFEKIKKEIA